MDVIRKPGRPKGSPKTGGRLEFASINITPRRNPPYLRKIARAYYALLILADGSRLSWPMDTGFEAVAKALLAVLIRRLVAEGRLDRRARAARLYLLEGRCPSCGRALPGAV
jgi:hypothetical protein